MKATRFLLATTLGLASAFTIFCSSDKDDDEGIDSIVGISSPSGGNTQASCPNAVTDNVHATVSCGGQTYRTVKIGEQVWMAENLNYAAFGSKCYAEGVSGVSADSSAKNCAKYGRLYNWSKAMAVCPFGWHLPSIREWGELYNYAYSMSGSSGLCFFVCSASTVGICTADMDPYLLFCSTVGMYLKAESSNGMDVYGFSALLGGQGQVTVSYILPDGDIGRIGYWWSHDFSNGYYLYMKYDSEQAYSGKEDIKSKLYSVRCLQDRF